MATVWLGLSFGFSLMLSSPAAASAMVAVAALSRSLLYVPAARLAAPAAPSDTEVEEAVVTSAVVDGFVIAGFSGGHCPMMSRIIRSMRGTC